MMFWFQMRDKRTISAGFSLLLLCMAVGCASPGPPRPPSLNLSQPATDLTAQRVGDQVLLRWTTPDKTTDGLPIKQNLTVRVCRTAFPAVAGSSLPPGANLAPPLLPPVPAANQPTPPCNEVLRVAVHPGVSTATDSLPANLTADPVALLDYRVEIENAATHTAGPSNPAFSAAGTAPAPVESLHASAIPSGAMLEWAAVPTLTRGRPAPFLELNRINSALVAPPRSSTKAKSQPLQLAGAESPEVHLRASSPATGTIDPTARFGQTYLYTAQRVRPIQLNGHAIEVRSVVSPTITLTLRDTFPPAAPTGLATIPTTTPQPGIDLSWQPNAEPDLAGYIVYRRDLAGTTPTRLTPTAIPGSAFRDATAAPGQRYAYTVTAIDTNNNESKASPEAEETLPNP
ncbi:MAG: Fibronectin type domain protein [Acidobacteriaceae bacterium]|nr:Fibronectin type domain protein [Acidobacteriaceae bacterium]